MKSSDYIQERFASTVKDARLFFSSCLSMHMVPVIFALVFIAVANRNSANKQVTVELNDVQTTVEVAETKANKSLAAVADTVITYNDFQAVKANFTDIGIAQVSAGQTACVQAFANQTTLSLLKIFSGPR
jgi:hypothetical protein